MQIGLCLCDCFKKTTTKKKKNKRKEKETLTDLSICAVVLFVPLVVLSSCSDSTLHLLLRGENTKRGAGKHSTHTHRAPFNGSKYLY